MQPNKKEEELRKRFALLKKLRKQNPERLHKLVEYSSKELKDAKAAQDSTSRRNQSSAQK